MSLKFVPEGPIDNKPGLESALVPNRRHPIIWTNADPIHWRINTTPGGDVLKPW